MSKISPPSLSPQKPPKTVVLKTYIREKVIPKLRKNVKVTRDQLRIDFKQAFREAANNKLQYCLGCSTVFVVVLLIAILVTAISYSPVVFLSLSESSVGELDLVLRAQEDNQRLNYTQMTQQIQWRYHTPRIQTLKITTVNPDACIGYNAANETSNDFLFRGPSDNGTLDQDIRDLYAAYRDECRAAPAFCFEIVCNKITDGLLYAIDFDRERELGIGRSWEYPSPGPNEGYIDRAFAESLGVKVGDTIMVITTIANVFPTTIKVIRDANPNFPGSSQSIFPITVIGVLRTPEGKYNEDDQSVILLEWKTLFQTLSSHLTPTTSASTRDVLNVALENKLYNEDVDTVIFNCAEERVSCYLSSEYTAIAKSIVDWSSDIVLQLGPTVVRASLPILQSLQSTQFFTGFLNLLLTMVVILLLGLSTFLIYSLLMISVETKTFEMGVLRMIGLTRSGLILYLMVLALSYSLPAWVFGLIGAQSFWIVLKNLLAKLLFVEVGATLSGNAVLLSTALGLLVPFLAAVLPIRRALSKNLHDALDMRHSKTKAVIVTIERNESSKLPTGFIIIGSIMTMFGFSIYYFFPLALLSQNLTLLFNIFLIILFGLFLGLVLLGMNAQPLIERMVTWAFFKIFFFENRCVPELVTKNLLAHRLRNKKTSMLYAICLAFIVFLTVAVRTELNSIIYVNSRISAGEFTVNAPQDDSYEPEDVLGAMDFLRADEDVETFGQRSLQLLSVDENVTETSIMNLGRLVRFTTRISAATPNIFDLADPIYLVPESVDQSLSGAYSLSEQMYTVKGSYSAHMGSLFQSKLALKNFTSRFFLRKAVNNEQNTTFSYYFMTPLSFLRAAPIFRFSSFPSLPSQDMVVSLPTFLDMLDPNEFTSVRHIPLFRTFIRLKPSVQSNVGATRAFGERLQFSLAKSLSVSALEDRIKTFVTAQSTLTSIFLIITIIIMTIAFFSLNSSMVVNIIEQVREIGILRALGINRWLVIRIYWAEAFILVMSSAIVGTIIGVVVGWSLTAQRSIITEIPLSFVFPTDIFLVVLAVSFVSAGIATVSPVVKLVFRKRLVSLLR